MVILKQSITTTIVDTEEEVVIVGVTDDGTQARAGTGMRASFLPIGYFALTEAQKESMAEEVKSPTQFVVRYEDMAQIETRNGRKTVLGRTGERRRVVSKRNARLANAKKRWRY